MLPARAAEAPAPAAVSPLAHWSDIAARVAHASGQAEVLHLLRLGAQALGAQSAYFVSVVRDAAALRESRHLLACDPAWCRHYLSGAGLAHDPWLAYATSQTNPIMASALEPRGSDQRRVVELAARSGF